MSAQQNEIEVDVEEMLRACMAEVQGSGLSFIESLNEWYENNGFLTEGQITGLQKFYDNL